MGLLKSLLNMAVKAAADSLTQKLENQSTADEAPASPRFEPEPQPQREEITDWNAYFEDILKTDFPQYTLSRNVAVTDLARDDMAEAVEDAFRYGKMICMASSYDAGVFPPMYDFLHHLDIKAYQRRRVGLVENGSWAPSAAKTMRPMLEGMKQVEIVEPVVTLRGCMKDADIPQLEALAEAMMN